MMIVMRSRERRTSREERLFWGRFPSLLFDDPEDELNELVGILRRTANKYFKDKEDKDAIQDKTKR